LRGAHAQTLPIKRLDDFGGEDRFELLGVRAFAPQVAEDISTPAHHFQQGSADSRVVCVSLRHFILAHRQRGEAHRIQSRGAV
jgi:hypothetical protein